MRTSTTIRLLTVTFAMTVLAAAPANADDIGPTTTSPGGAAATTAPPAASATKATTATTKAPATATPVAAVVAPSAIDHMTTGRTAVQSKDWKVAISEFSAAVGANPKDADANNMLGYSYRKSGDLTNAFKYYAAALAINPNHTGALEYQGEAFVMAGKTAQAKANLAKLKTLCGLSCEQYKDLAAFIAKPPKKK